MRCVILLILIANVKLLHVMLELWFIYFTLIEQALAFDTCKYFFCLFDCRYDYHCTNCLDTLPQEFVFKAEIRFKVVISGKYKNLNKITKI